MTTDLIAAKAQKLLSEGYWPTSNKHRMLSRIDRVDWREKMGGAHARGADWVNGLGRHAADHYRRVYSRDTISVSPSVFDAVKKIISAMRSRLGPTEFRPKQPEIHGKRATLLIIDDLGDKK